MNAPGPDDYTDEELHALFHNNHEAAFAAYISGSRHSSDKQAFLFDWMAPAPDDFILECGSSSGKTCVDLSRRGNCRTLGVDFDAEAVRISSAMRDRYFPGLKERCQFVLGDLTTMRFDPGLTKILMPDFTEHIPDRVLLAILRNIRRQFDDIELFIYTPARSHVFEILKHHNILLKNPSGHINVKTMAQLLDVLRETGWVVTSAGWRCSSMWYVKPIELAFGYLPIVGKYFQRRLAIKARPDKAATS
ncbi:class I SAM-dependent methyltransferase [Parasulfuritortus cantonensis]|uniref:Class I SAM-dependent methyltransferase n=1 Tax=Parasulfuritortus cantonensis TaxID=2528202 RepID=A0A4R1BCG7_9PROT|nr:class I SAM-dependent methyltransferase [Parasulfuritortus cantonensis]TCJ14740.1 class I SAM-dependent methyltransferase [Parasulfuritortus cantonensis]